jgi:hypothetical protein
MMVVWRSGAASLAGTANYARSSSALEVKGNIRKRD